MNPNTFQMDRALPSKGEVPAVMVQGEIPLSSAPCHLLIVDDIPDIRQFLREGLETYGYHCDEAQHGLEALRKLRVCHYPIVLTDLQMPFLDGFELVKYIQKDPSLGNPMLIMMTAGDRELLAPLAVALKIKTLLSKPCLPADIHHVILNEQGRFPRAA